MTILIVATRNKHKVGEIQAIASGAFQCLALTEFPEAPTPIEDGNTFAENASKKAIAIARWVTSNPTSLARKVPTGSVAYVLADDSGLEVDALHGAPGVHSARFAALDTGNPGNSPDPANNAKLLRLLENVPLERRTARFHCVLALVKAAAGATTGSAELFDGLCEGHIAFAPSGRGGFGYDPLFIPNGYRESFAELGEAVKNGLSHRARALEKLKAFLATQR